MDPTRVDKVARIAMWSGPRNISTALMRAWESRPDTAVCDEPLYAPYLLETRLDHPGRDEVLRHHETDWREVVRSLTRSAPDDKCIFYQKHMAHHLLPGMDREWVLELRNAFLIRDPEEMLTSLVHFIPSPRVEDTGLPQQWELFQLVREKTGSMPPVVDARDVLTDPEGQLATLCEALGVPFDPAMLEWEPGRRASDGVWAKHWYKSVEQSTGFRPYKPKPDRVPERLRDVHRECRRYYEKLYAHRLRS